MVLFDFGLSRFIGQKWDGKFAGTAIYTAPEILQEMRVVEECRSSASPTGGGERAAAAAAAEDALARREKVRAPPLAQLFLDRVPPPPLTNTQKQSFKTP